MAMGGVKNEVCRLRATRIPKNSGSILKMASMGRKIGTKMMMISLHSNGQPRRKIISCASMRNINGDRFIDKTKSLMMSCPPRYEKTEAKVQEPTKSQHTIADVRTVK